VKDTRVAFFRKTLEDLLDSLDATIQLAQWDAAESASDALKESAAHVVTRLGAVDRLAASNVKGSPADAGRLDVMLATMRRLDAAFVSYRQSLGRAPSDRAAAVTALSEEVAKVRSDQDWQA
jgi:hypothetical protein